MSKIDAGHLGDEAKTPRLPQRVIKAGLTMIFPLFLVRSTAKLGLADRIGAFVATPVKK